MQCSFRQLSPADTRLLRELLVVFADAFGEHATYQDAAPGEAYLRGFLQKTHCITLVALRDDAVIGGLVAYELDKFEQERKEIYIYDLAVAEACRRQGVGRGLLIELKKLARIRGAYVIYVQADRGDDPAIGLYASLGVREDVYHFDIDPGD